MLAFVDTETTGLVPGQHQVWEVSVLTVEPETLEVVGEIDAFLRVSVAAADPGALSMNGFYSRYPLEGTKDRGALADPAEVALAIAINTADATIVGMNPRFDMAHLQALLHGAGLVPAWRHSPEDARTRAGAVAGMDPPYKMKDLLGWYGLAGMLDEARGLRHTARGDAQIALALYKAARERTDLRENRKR